MNFQKAEFEFSAGKACQLPDSTVPEIVFSGKSNVGKSTLINKLLSRKQLARVSSSPGKTATINSYLLGSCRFIDLPGYGYAKVSKTEKMRFAGLVEGYFSVGRNVKLIIQILDARHKPTADDIDMLNFLQDTAYDFIVVCTKCDKLNKTELLDQANYFNSLFDDTGIEYLFFSATKGTGLESLKERVAGAVLG